MAAFTAGLLAAPVDVTEPPLPKAALVLDASGAHLVDTIRSPEQREEVAGTAMPVVLRSAVVAAEDERFFSHKGVDPFALVRAGFHDITGGHVEGGSTITQQYVKNVYTGSQRTFLRKIREAALAIRLEERLPKSEILTRYLNTLYLGNGTYGVQAASKYYFGVPVQHLDCPNARCTTHDQTLALARAALLAGMAPAPSVWNPVHDRHAARVRQLYVLNRMVTLGMVTPTQASAAYGSDLPRIVKANAAPPSNTIAPEFSDIVREQLRKTYGDQQLFRGGLRVTTTLNWTLQQAVVAAVKDVLPSPSDPEAAVVAIDPRNGNLVALTTKRDGGYHRDGYDLATDAARSTGSVIKPFTLAAALEAGHSLTEGHYSPHCTTVHKKDYQPWRVCNAEASEGGFFTLRTGLIYSVNTLYGPLANEVGQDKVRAVAIDAGLEPTKNIGVNPAMALGVEVTPISVARAYGTFADHGVRHDVRMVLKVREGGNGGADSGALISSVPDSPSGQQVIPKRVADTVDSVMLDVVNQGTGTAARQPFPVFGKTGTGEQFWDAWFVGCTPTVCIATWMGYDKPRPMRGVEGQREVFGGTLPAEIFARTWAHVKELNAPKPIPLPSFSSTPRHRIVHSPVSPQPSVSKSTTPKPSPSSPAPSQTTPIVVPTRSSSPTATPAPT